MNQSELHRTGEILISVAATLKALTWPDSSRAFGRAAKNLVAQGNTLASKFLITNDTLGTNAHEFTEIRTLMHFATLISYDSQDWQSFNIRISARGSKHILRRCEATTQEQEEAKALLLAHWQEAYGYEYPEV